MAEKKSFILYSDCEAQWEMLTDEQAGMLIKALMSYVSSGETPDLQDNMVKMAFFFMASQIDRDSEKFKKKCERNAEYYKKTKKSKSENSDKLSTIQPDSDKLSKIQSNSDSDTDTEPDTEPEPDTETETDTEPDTECLRTESSSACADAHAPAHTQAVKSKAKKKRSAPHLYGKENVVRLTDEEYAELCEDYGKTRIDEYITRCGRYCRDKKRTYSDYAGTIRSWLERDGVQKGFDVSEYMEFVNRFDLAETGGGG